MEGLGEGGGGVLGGGGRVCVKLFLLFFCNGPYSVRKEFKSPQDRLFSG